jgi:hypothetical protein
MSRKAFNLNELIRSRFEGADRETMNKAHELGFGMASPIITDDQLRSRLCDRWAPDSIDPDSDGPATTAPPVSAERATAVPRMDGSKIPNLRPTGKWEGRMRRVTIHKTNQQSRSEAIKIGYEGNFWTIEFEKPVDMPWPWWQSLKNTYFVDDRSDAVTKWVRDEATGQLDCVRTSRNIPTIPFTDHGDVPGTEDLPESYFDFYMREAKRTNCFDGFSRAALMMVHNTLREPRGPKYGEEAFNATYFRDMKDVDIRIRIAEALGPAVEALMQDSVYAA